MKQDSKKLYIIAHNIRSAYNVGAIFRTADGMGAVKLFLTGYSPAPFEGKKLLQTAAQKMIAKTALGAEKTLSWQQFENINDLLEKLKAENIEIIALEQDDRSIDYREYFPKGSVALILGNEPSGIEVEVVEKCDRVIDIPMRGQKNSLNVSVALGIVGYELYNKLETKNK